METKTKTMAGKTGGEAGFQVGARCLCFTTWPLMKDRGDTLEINEKIKRDSLKAKIIRSISSKYSWNVI